MSNHFSANQMAYIKSLARDSEKTQSLSNFPTETQFFATVKFPLNFQISIYFFRTKERQENLDAFRTMTSQKPFEKKFV